MVRPGIAASQPSGSRRSGGSPNGRALVPGTKNVYPENSVCRSHLTRTAPTRSLKWVAPVAGGATSCARAQRRQVLAFALAVGRRRSAPRRRWPAPASRASRTVARAPRRPAKGDRRGRRGGGTSPVDDTSRVARASWDGGAKRGTFWHTRAAVGEHPPRERAHERNRPDGPAGTLPDSRDHRRRRDGVRVQGVRSRDQPLARDQAPEGAAAPRRRVPQPLPARGEGRRRAVAPEHRDGVRRGRGRRATRTSRWSWSRARRSRKSSRRRSR